MEKMSDTPPQRKIIAHRSSQTGDTLHVAGTLALYAEVDVIVIHVGDIGTTEGLLNLYRQATDSTHPGAAIGPDSAANNDRVKVVYASDKGLAQKVYEAFTSAYRIKTAFAGIQAHKHLSSETPEAGAMPAELKRINSFVDFEREYLKANANDPNAKYEYMGGLGKATLAIAEKFKAARTADEHAQTADNQKDLYTTLAKKLTARDLAPADIIKGTPQEPKFGPQNLPDATSNTTPIVLLWARYTGTNTAIGHNPEGDSCVQGQKQINGLLNSLGFEVKVVTVGHGPRGSSPFSTEFDVGEFYKQDPITSDRATQQSFFLALMEKYPGRVYQIGQKTGAMDGPALLGIPTIYLEHKGSPSIERMKKWTDDGKSDDGTLHKGIPFYRSVIIDKPAPAIVRALKFNPDTKTLYNSWKNNPEDPLRRARARLAAMVFLYPAEMVKDENGVPDKPPNIMTTEIENPWKTEEQKQKWFETTVKWVESLPDTDVQEDMNDPTLDGKWTKRVQTVSQKDLGTGTAGYSKEDLDNIKKEIQGLIQIYSTKNAAVLRTKGGYQTRYEYEASLVADPKVDSNVSK